MRNSLVLLTILSVVTSSCAAPLSKARQSASMPSVDEGDIYFVEIPDGACEPNLTGLRISENGARKLFQAIRQEARDHETEVIDLKSQIDAAVARKELAEKQAQTGAFWASWGIPLILSGVLGGLVAGFAAGRAK